MNDATAGRSLSVLVVDHDAATRGLIATSLRRGGLEVIEADSGPSALEIVETGSVGLVICDLVMPGMSGIEIVQALRRRPESATLPIILVTGSGDEQSVIAGLDAGADDFLTKPIRLDELSARVRAQLRTHAAWTRTCRTSSGSAPVSWPRSRS